MGLVSPSAGPAAAAAAAVCPIRERRPSGWRARGARDRLDEESAAGSARERLRRRSRHGERRRRRDARTAAAAEVDAAVAMGAGGGGGIYQPRLRPQPSDPEPPLVCVSHSGYGTAATAERLRARRGSPWCLIKSPTGGTILNQLHMSVSRYTASVLYKLGEGERAFSTGRWGGGGVCVRWSKQKRAARGVRLSESGSGFYWICFTEKRGIACDVGLLLETMETAPSSSMAQRRGSRRRSTATPNLNTGY